MAARIIIDPAEKAVGFLMFTRLPDVLPILCNLGDSDAL